MSKTFEEFLVVSIWFFMCLFSLVVLVVVDFRNKAIRLYDVKRSEVYKTHLGEKLR